MKKEKVYLFAIVIFVALVFILILNTNRVYAVIDVNNLNSEDPLGIGLNPADIPTNPEELTDKSLIAYNYLELKFKEFIINNSVTGPIHKSFLEHPAIFIGIFNEPYNLNLIFLAIICLWIFLWTVSIDILNSIWGRKFFSWIIALAIPIVLAKIGFLFLLIKFFSWIILKSNTLWIRGIIIILIIILLVIIKIFTRKMYFHFAAIKREKRTRNTEKKANNAEKGVAQIGKYIQKKEAKKKEKNEGLTDEEVQEIEEEAEKDAEGLGEED